MYDNFNPPPSPPPPAYSEQEFDRKVSTALQVSLATPQPPATGEVWEEWDEEAYQLAASRLAQINASTANASSSNRNSFGPRQPRGVEPLRIAKRAPMASPPPSSKPRPSWYAEAGLDSSASQAGPSSAVQGTQSRVLSARPSPSPAPIPQPVHHDIPDDDSSEGHSLPPPPFAPVAPPLDGPPYQAHQSPPPSPLRSPPIASSPLPQNPHSPFNASFDQRIHQQYASTVQPLRQTSPLPQVIPRQQSPVAIQPVNTGHQRLIPPLTRMDFNPSVAYTPTPGLSAPQQSQAPVNPSEFYNSAVSAHLGTPNLPQRFAPKPPVNGGGLYNPSQPAYMRPQPQAVQMQHSGGYYQPPGVAQAWPPPAPRSQTMIPGGVPYQQPYQYPAYSYGGNDRWAASEQDFTRNFQ
ncbi:hypothetical protein AX16_003192 [Volvariella volvacea WC 439]|nr:hypothetical protein AX16_003192 [Volvariella volvacea WC 439]